MVSMFYLEKQLYSTHRYIEVIREKRSELKGNPKQRTDGKQFKSVETIGKCHEYEKLLVVSLDLFWLAFCICMYPNISLI